MKKKTQRHLFEHFLFKTQPKILTEMIVKDYLKGRGQERPLDFLAIFKVLKNS